MRYPTRCISVLGLLFTLFLGPLWAEEWAVAIHGGAGGDPSKWSAEEKAAKTSALETILKDAADFLEEGGNALDCVENTVKALEDCELFNAGKGAVFNSQGKHELDASIMDGQDRACGAVAGVKTVKNPISLARLVMQNTRHVLLQGAGAESFADEARVPRVPNSHFSTEKRRRQWLKKTRYQKGTVGCVARDSQGNLAAATSTGGLTDKKWGRVGDSPIVGAGCYADNRSCAVSCTGTGEEFIRRCIAHDLSARMLYSNVNLTQAGEEVLASLPENCGGFIAVDKDGKITLRFNTKAMVRGAANSDGLFETALSR